MNADDDERIRVTLARARRLTEGEPEPLRQTAYRAVLEHLLRGAPTVVHPQPAVALAPDMDLAEFLAAKKAATHPDRVVAIAYFVYHTQDGAGVTTQDLTDSYSRARLKKPQNFPDVIAACVRKGRLVEGERKDGMKSWVITRTGESHVEQSL